jgi:hypothetical protein
MFSSRDASLCRFNKHIWYASRVDVFESACSFLRYSNTLLQSTFELGEVTARADSRDTSGLRNIGMTARCPTQAEQVCH